MDEQLIHVNEINPYYVIKDIFRNLWVVALLVLSAWMAVNVYEKMSFEPQYTSETTFVISAKGNSSAYSSLSLTSNMAEVYSEVFKSNILLEKVEAKMEGETLDGYITASIVPNTNLMVVGVVSGSPEQSFRVLKLVIETYPEISDAMFSNAVLSVIKEPEVPMVPSNYFSASAYRRNAVLGAFAVGILLISLISILRDTLQSPAAAKRKLDSRLLHTVRHEIKNKTLAARTKKKNVAPLVVHPLISNGFKEDNHSLCSKVEFHMRKRGQKVLLVSSAGENEGKSTVAANLALCLAAQGKKVALLDCDFRKPALHKIFALTPDKKKDFGHYLTTPGSPMEFLLPSRKGGVMVGVNSSGHKHPQRMFTSPRMAECIAQLRETMDYIILDTPPMLVAADTEALAGYADVAMLVVREDGMMTRDVNDCMDALRRTTPDFAGYAFNNCYTTENLHKFR